MWSSKLAHLRHFYLEVAAFLAAINILEVNPAPTTPPVTEHKFLCPTHSEAKQTKMSEFGAEEGLLQGHARRQVARAQNTPNSPKSFSKALLKAR